MTPATIISRVGADGILSVTIPLSPAAANEEVRQFLRLVERHNLTLEDDR